MKKAEKFLLVSTNEESNVGVLKIKFPSGGNVLDVDGAELVDKLETALAEHFDIDDLKVTHLDVKSCAPMSITANFTLETLSGEEKLVCELMETYLY